MNTFTKFFATIFFVRSFYTGTLSWPKIWYPWCWHVSSSAIFFRQQLLQHVTCAWRGSQPRWWYCAEKVLPPKNLNYRRGLGLSREKGDRQIYGIESRIRTEHLIRWHSDLLCWSLFLWSILLCWSMLWSRLRSLVTEATKVFPEYISSCWYFLSKIL